MKTKLYTLIAAAGIFIFLTSELNFGGGSPGAKSGSPGDGGATCTSCHDDGSASAVDNWISTNIPTSGYIPGETYTVTATGMHTGVNRFGFELTAEDNSNAKTGSFVITDEVATKLTNSNASVTHLQAGTTPSGNTKTWSMNWTAPAAGTGDVTFYAAFNAANGNGNTAGDVIYTSSQMVVEDILSSIAENANDLIKVYPNPVTDYVMINSVNSEITEINIINMEGSVVYQNNSNISQNTKISLSELQAGMYHIVLNTASSQKVSKTIIKL